MSTTFPGLDECLEEHLPREQLREVNRILYGKELTYVLSRNLQTS